MPKHPIHNHNITLQQYSDIMEKLTPERRKELGVELFTRISAPPVPTQVPTPPPGMRTSSASNISITVEESFASLPSPVYEVQTTEQTTEQGSDVDNEEGSEISAASDEEDEMEVRIDEETGEPFVTYTRVKIEHPTATEPQN